MLSNYGTLFPIKRCLQNIQSVDISVSGFYLLFDDLQIMAKAYFQFQNFKIILKLMEVFRLFSVLICPIDASNQLHPITLHILP